MENERFSVKPLTLRHGELSLEFSLYPPNHQLQNFYVLPISPPRTYKQRLLMKVRHPFKHESEITENVQVVPFSGGVVLHPASAWELYKYLSSFLDGELNNFYLQITDTATKDPLFTFKTPEQETDKAVLYLMAEGQTASKITKRGRIGFGMQEVYAFARYIKTYAMFEVSFVSNSVSNSRVFRLLRWTEDYLFYDAEPSQGVIQGQGRDKLLQLLSEYLEGKEVKPLSFQERILFKMDKESDKLLIIPLMRPPIALEPNQAKELYLFLK